MKYKTYAMLASLLLMLVATLTSCEKLTLEDSSNGSKHEADANVFIRVNQVENTKFSEITKATSTTKVLSDISTRITFAVFDGEEKVATINETSDEDDFGQAELALDEGEYRLVVIAHSGEGNCTISSPEKVKFSSNKLTDTFYYYGRLSVTEDGAENNISLKRAVAKFNLHIDDDHLPENAHSIKFYYTGGSSTLDATTGYGCVNSRQTETFKLSEDVKDYVVYTFPHEDSNKINMTVSILDPDAQVTRTFKNSSLTMECNKVTRSHISLDKSSSSTTGGITITFDDDWGEDIDGGTFN